MWVRDVYAARTPEGGISKSTLLGEFCTSQSHWKNSRESWVMEKLADFQNNNNKTSIWRITNQELLWQWYCKMTSLSETGPLCSDWWRNNIKTLMSMWKIHLLLFIPFKFQFYYHTDDKQEQYALKTWFYFISRTLSPLRTFSLRQFKTLYAGMIFTNSLHFLYVVTSKDFLQPHFPSPAHTRFLDQWIPGAQRSSAPAVQWPHLTGSFANLPLVAASRQNHWPCPKHMVSHPPPLHLVRDV